MMEKRLECSQIRALGVGEVIYRRFAEIETEHGTDSVKGIVPASLNQGLPDGGFHLLTKLF